MPYEYTCAYLLGLDGRHFLDEPVSQACRAVLARFDDPDAEGVGIVVRSSGRLVIERHDQIGIFERFRWYRLGAGL